MLEQGSVYECSRAAVMSELLDTHEGVFTLSTEGSQMGRMSEETPRACPSHLWHKYHGLRKQDAPKFTEGRTYPYPALNVSKPFTIAQSIMTLVTLQQATPTSTMTMARTSRFLSGRYSSSMGCSPCWDSSDKFRRIHKQAEAVLLAQCGARRKN